MADFYLDHNVARGIATLMREVGHNVRTARDIGLERVGDDEHLLTAAQRDWILATHNRKDFDLLHDAWRRWSAAWGVVVQHAGILIIPELPHTQAAQVLIGFTGSGLPLPNELYVWRPSRGWTRRP